MATRVVLRPAAAAVPNNSKLGSWAQQVNDRISRLDTYAIRLGQQYGLASDTLFLVSDQRKAPPPPDPDSRPVLVDSTPIDQVTLEPIGNQWGLYYYRGLADPRRQSARPGIVHLKDAPLIIRERFLLQAEGFFRRYIEGAKERIERVKESVAGGDAALAFLSSELDEV